MPTTSSTETNTTAASTTPTNINPDQAVAFAALILADDNLVVTPKKLQTLLTAAGITEVEPIWTTLFANALKDKDVKEILTAVAASSPKAGGDVATPTHRGDESDRDASEVDGIELGCDSDDDDGMGTLGLFG